MRKLLTTGFMIGVGFALSGGISADAASFDFNFTGLANTATTSNGGIQTYMNSIVGALGTVAVSGANGGATADNSYTGDGHVVGPTCTVSGSSSCEVTLANPLGSGNPSPNTYIKTTSNGTGDAAITFTFSLTNITIDSVAFDYEIFPDNTCLTTAVTSKCPNGAPDFTFGTNINANVFTALGTTPTGHGTVADASNSCNSSGGSPGPTGTHVCTYEQTPQKIVLGTTTGGVYTPGTGYLTSGVTGATSFTFTDWPATIGIDNFVVTYQTNTVPEPTSIVLLATVTFLVGRQVRRKMRTNA